MKLHTIAAALALLWIPACADAPTSPQAASPTAGAAPAGSQASALSVAIDGPQFIYTAGQYEWNAVAAGGNGTYTYYWTLEEAYTGPGTGQPTYFGSASSVGKYVDSGSSPYLYWRVTVTSGGETAYAEAYVCNFSASAMC